MKTKFLLIVTILFLSCNKETNNKSNNHKEINTIENNKSGCDKHYNYLDSIPVSKELNSKVSLELIKCISKDINTSKYIKAELISNHKYNGYYVVLYRLICNAGAVCRHYFISTMSNNYNINDVELIAHDTAEGENNKFVDNFKFMRGKLSFKLTTEYYDEEIQDYIINTEKKYFSIDKLGNVDENK